MGEQNNNNARYVVDPSLSRFTVRASTSGMLKAFGHDPVIPIRSFEGDVRFNGDDVESASLRLKIDASRLEAPDEMSSKDQRELQKVMREEVLETSKFPHIVFESGTVSGDKTGEGNYRVQIAGSLTMHGVTRQEPVSAQVILNGPQLRAFGDFSLRQTDYDIKLYSAVGGGLKLKDDLQFAFDLVARKAPDSGS